MKDKVILKRRNHDKNRYDCMRIRHNDACDHNDGYVRYARRYGRKFQGDVYVRVIRLFEAYIAERLLAGEECNVGMFDICVKQVFHKWSGTYRPELTIQTRNKYKFISRCYKCVPSNTFMQRLKEKKGVEYIMYK